MLDALEAWEALECTFEMSMERPNSLKVWAGLQHWNADFNKSGNFIKGDGCIHFLMVKLIKGRLF
jgi:hypothetical protein